MAEQKEATVTFGVLNETSDTESRVALTPDIVTRLGRNGISCIIESGAGNAAEYTDEDYQVLLRIVQAEAGICDPKGKILVADVIINRVLSGKFPDSVKAVVYQPSQFQPVSNGTINTVKVTAETIECVDRALAGEDYSNGALYFMNRRASGSAASWFDRRLTYLFAHDGHEFFR